MRPAPPIQLSFGRQLRAARLAAGLSQLEVTTRAGLHSRAAIATIEAGRAGASLARLESLAAAVGRVLVVDLATPEAGELLDLARGLAPERLSLLLRFARACRGASIQRLRRAASALGAAAA